jgi:hypothetical protein
VGSQQVRAHDDAIGERLVDVGQGTAAQALVAHSCGGK